jgi:hypothetical protein
MITEKDKHIKWDEWLKRKRWTNFLLTIPLDKTKGYPFENGNDLTTIRVIASQMNSSRSCDRRFVVEIDFKTSIATITASLKERE